MRFYHIDPVALTRYPDELRRLLHMCVEPLRAEEQTHRVNSSRAGWLKPDNYRAMMERLHSLAQPYQPQQAHIVKVPPERAAWFEQNGIPFQIID